MGLYSVAILDSSSRVSPSEWCPLTPNFGHQLFSSLPASVPSIPSPRALDLVTPALDLQYLSPPSCRLSLYLALDCENQAFHHQITSQASEMGKRKAAKKPNKKAKLQPLDKVFRCLFCQHAGVVHCKMDRQEMISRIECARCAQYFEAKIDHLTEPIDVYSLWIDAAELANKHQDTSANASQHPSRDGHQQRANPERPRPSARPSGRASPKAPRREEPAENYDALNDDNDDLPENIF